MAVWIILAMKKDRFYYKVGEIEADTENLWEYGRVLCKAYDMQSKGELEIPFDWLTLYAVPDDPKYRHLYRY